MNNEITKILQRLCNYKHDSKTLFYDFIEMFAISLQNRMFGNFANDVLHLPQWLKNEERFEQLKKIYIDEYPAFIELVALITYELMFKEGDVLGELAGILSLTNKAFAQIFTPYHISFFMAQILLQDIELKIRTGDVITINEPCCGAGGMILAAAEVASKQCDITKSIFIVGQDIDINCVRMAYIQCEIKRIPAVIILGNTLLFECRQQWYTSEVFRNYDRFKHILERNK